MCNVLTDKTIEFVFLSNELDSTESFWHRCYTKIVSANRHIARCVFALPGWPPIPFVSVVNLYALARFATGSLLPIQLNICCIFAAICCTGKTIHVSGIPRVIFNVFSPEYGKIDLKKK